MTEVEEKIWLRLKAWLDENSGYGRDEEMYELLCEIFLSMDKKVNPIPPEEYLDGGQIRHV